MRRLLGRLRPRTLRGRLALLTAGAVFAGVVVLTTVTGVLVVRAATDQLAAELRAVRDTLVQASAQAPGPAAVCERLRSGVVPLPAGTGFLVQLTAPDGSVCGPPRSASVGPDETVYGPARAVLGGGLAYAHSSEGASLGVVRAPLAQGWRLDVAADIGGYERLAGRLRGVVVVLGLVGALLALLAGRAVARTSLRPVAALADEADRIARTEDLTAPVPVPDGHPGDEVVRLGTAFNRMVTALSASRERQARLVADAGHELRTPLTSLRTNVELLARSEAAGRPLPPDQRAALLADLTGQLAELGHLAAELTTLAGDEPPRPRADARFDLLAAAAVERARRRAAGRPFEVALEPWTVPDADATAVERAVLNLLDNAVKFSPPGAAVEVRLAGGVLTVDDAGPGVPEPEREAAFE
ncbi:MAG TPA: HAMP domain-containing sensor histidine kinase, partial [Kineosporiaceae bacterium]|nr:HAMP domain-containing sensor histidine kinase [Kineosporiaceae bacterium]